MTVRPGTTPVRAVSSATSAATARRICCARAFPSRISAGTAAPLVMPFWRASHADGAAVLRQPALRLVRVLLGHQSRLNQQLDLFRHRHFLEVGYRPLEH